MCLEQNGRRHDDDDNDDASTLRVMRMFLLAEVEFLCLFKCESTETYPEMVGRGHASSVHGAYLCRMYRTLYPHLRFLAKQERCVCMIILLCSEDADRVCLFVRLFLFPCLFCDYNTQSAILAHV